MQLLIPRCSRVNVEASAPPAGAPEALRDIEQRAIEVDKLRP